jgi:hypothetical protein
MKSSNKIFTQSHRPNKTAKKKQKKASGQNVTSGAIPPPKKKKLSSLARGKYWRDSFVEDMAVEIDAPKLMAEYPQRFKTLDEARVWLHKIHAKVRRDREEKKHNGHLQSAPSEKHSDVMVDPYGVISLKKELKGEINPQ